MRELRRYLPRFDSAVVTVVGADGFPASVRCRPVLDASRVRLEVLGPADALRAGPASLLCHRHDEQAWNLLCFLVRGRLERDGDQWVLVPERFVPGLGVGGPVGMVRALMASRKAAQAFLDARGSERPRVPWDEIAACY